MIIKKTFPNFIKIKITIDDPEFQDNKPSGNEKS